MSRRHNHEVNTVAEARDTAKSVIDEVIDKLDEDDGTGRLSIVIAGLLHYPSGHMKRETRRVAINRSN